MSNAYNTDGMAIFPSNGNDGFIENAFESIECTIAFDVRSWSEDRRSAWIYAIVFDWDDDAFQELAALYHWDEADIARAKRLHEQWERAKEWIGRVDNGRT